MLNNPPRQDALARPAPGTGKRRAVKDRLTHEITRFLVIFVYLWVLLGMFVLYENILRREAGLGFQAQGLAAINALVLAKVMLVAEDLNLGGRLRRRPLAYAILGEALLFTIVFIAFHILEKLAIGLLHGASLARSVPVIGGGGITGLLTVAAIMFVLLIPYFAFRDLGRALGWERTRALLFQAPPPADTHH
jgi:hypothetical protein